MINCPDFLARYSEFRDGVLDPRDQERFARHLAGCESCARYDRVVEGGIRTLRTLPEMSLSPDFLERLDDRLAHTGPAGEPRVSGGTPVSLVVAVAAAIGAAAWLPTLRADSPPLRLPPAVAHAPYHPGVLPLVYHPGFLPAARASADFSPYSLLGAPPAKMRSVVARSGH